jgi:chromosomal replication initiation ATPase DnaA
MGPIEQQISESYKAAHVRLMRGEKKGVRHIAIQDNGRLESVSVTKIKPEPPVLIEHIKKMICHEFGLTKAELHSDCRGRSLSRPRQIAMYLCSRYSGKSLPYIGQKFNRDHSTVVHAKKVIACILAEGGEMADRIKELESRYHQ